MLFRSVKYDLLVRHEHDMHVVYEHDHTCTYLYTYHITSLLLSMEWGP